MTDSLEAVCCELKLVSRGDRFVQLLLDGNASNSLFGFWWCVAAGAGDNDGGSGAWRFFLAIVGVARILCDGLLFALIVVVVVGLPLLMPGGVIGMLGARPFLRRGVVDVLDDANELNEPWNWLVRFNVLDDTGRWLLQYFDGDANDASLPCKLSACNRIFGCNVCRADISGVDWSIDPFLRWGETNFNIFFCFSNLNSKTFFQTHLQSSFFY